MSVYVCFVEVPKHHHNAQSLRLNLVCSEYCNADRQLSPALLEAAF